jgi:hypothetical protein
VEDTHVSRGSARLGDVGIADSRYIGTGALGPSPEPRYIVALVVFVGAVVAVYFATSSTRLDDRIVWGSLGLGAYLTTLFLLLFSRYRYFGLFELRLGAWFLAYAAIAFGPATATIVQLQFGSGLAVDTAQIPTALLLVGVGFTCWAVGYGLGRARVFRTPILWGKHALSGRSTLDLRAPGVLVAIFFIGVFADVLTAIVSGKYGYLGDSTLVTADSATWYTQPLAIVSSLKFAALFGLSARVFMGRNDRFLKFLFPIFAIAIAMSLVSGLKETFVTTLVAVGVPFLLGKSKRRVMWIIGAVMLFVFVITPLVSGLRQDINDSGGRLDLGNALTLAVNNVASGEFLSQSAGPTSIGGSDASSAAVRIRLIDNLALIVDKTPSQIPYRSLGELAAAPFVGFIPRLVWPDKPVRLSGYEFYTTYYEGQGQSSSAITLEGSLYLYGGLWVLAIGMFAVGILTRVVDSVLNAVSDLHGALFFMVLFNVVIKQELDVASFLAGLVVFIVTWFVAVHLIFRSRTTHAISPPPTMRV